MPEPRGDLAQAAAIALRPPGRKTAPKTRQAARCRRVATRIAWRSSGSLPSRVPASRASIRARWKRMTLRPASATWSSAVTPGVLPTTSRLSVGATSSTASLMTSDEVGVTGLRSEAGSAAVAEDAAAADVLPRGRPAASRTLGFGGAIGPPLGARPASAPPPLLGRPSPVAVRRPLGRGPVAPASRSSACARLARPPERTAASAASSLLPLAGARAGSAAKTSASGAEPLLGALDQLRLELHEAVDDARRARRRRPRRGSARRACRRRARSACAAAGGS